ncbi:MAG: ATP-dependent helicase, partial [Acidimicrobiia bacterium]
MPPTPHTLAHPDDWEEALGAVAGPQLVLAGPGTGKTQFLAHRAARLIEAGTPAPAVVVLTFSRRSASELEGRIENLLTRPASGATATTFHSFAHRLVETSRAAQGRAMPVLMTGPEQVRLVGQLLSSEDPSRWPSPFRPLLSTVTFAAEVADFVMRCQERLLTGPQLAELAEKRADWSALPAFLTAYRHALDQTARVDYGTLLLEAVDVISRGEHTDQFEYVLVDEYQDTSPVQTRLAESLAGPGGNITVAADPHQSIYSFRGADLDNVEGFVDRMKGRTGQDPTVWLLSRSLRVPAPILESARRIVAPNPVAGPLRLDVTPAAHPGTVEAYTFDQRSAEAEWIAGEVERLHRADGVQLREMAVVVRSTRHLLPELSRALERRRIPHDRPDTRLVDHPAIRMIHDVVIAATSAPNGDERRRAVRRLLLGPLLHLPLGLERDLVRRSRREGAGWPETIRQYLPDATSLADLIDDPTWATDLPAVQGFWHVWDNLPHLESLVIDPERGDYRAAWTSLARMLDRQSQRDTDITLAAWFEATLAGDFEETPLLSFSRPEHDRLVVTTLHQAKGLEFQ